MSNVEEMAACERLLEFAYDELAGEEAEKFRAHLESCAKCRAELDGIRRVRGAVKAALPVVEPPEAASGALHAQLLHAAAQRRPVARGKLLLLARKVMQHPAYAAAAMFLLVGGAVGVEWSRGRLFMPEPKLAQAPVAAPATEAAAPAPPAEVPPPAPPAATATANSAPAAAEPQIANDSAGRLGAFRKSAPVGASGAYELERAKAKDALEGAQQKTRYYLDTKGDGRPMEVQLAQPHAHATAKKQTRQGGPGAATRSDTSDGLMFDSGGGGHAGAGSARGYRGGASDKNWNGEPARQAFGGAPPSTPYATAPAQPEAPAPAPAARPSVDDRAVAQTLAGEGKVAEHRAHGTAKAERSAAVVPKAAAPTSTSNPDSLRKRAVEAANANRCDEAIRLYQELERNHPRYRIAPRDRLGYVRCLRASGREQQALDELNAIEPSAPARKRHEAPPAQRAEEKAPAPAKAAPPPRDADQQEAASSKKKSAKPAAAAPAEADTPSY